MTASPMPAVTYLHDPEAVYRFGPLEAPLLKLNATDDQGCIWVCEEPEGWAAPAAVTPMDERSYGDGGYAGETTFEPRALNFGASVAGLTICPSRQALLQAMQRLRKIAGTRDAVLYTQHDYPSPSSLWLRASGQPKMRRISEYEFEWAFVMVAEDPLKFDAQQMTQALTVGLPRAVGGHRYNLRYPLIYGLTNAGNGAVIVDNAGDEFSQAIYKIKGPFDRPTVLVGATGAYFTIDRQGGSLDVVTVDTAAGTVLLNGTSIYGDLDGGFPLIPPGKSTVQWSHRGVYNTAARLTVTTTSTRK